MIQKQIEPAVVEYLHSKASKNRIPLSGTFELTPVCNMDCKMCYVRISKSEQEKAGRLRSKEEWIGLAKECREAGMLFLLLTGGEPFIRNDFKEIYIALHKMGFVISINSNGTMINEDTVQWLKKYPPSRINITLYGASQDTYKNLCGYSNGYDKVIKAIKLLKKSGILVKLNGSMTQYNRNDLQKMVEFSEQEELVFQITNYMFPPLRKDCSKVGTNVRFTEEEAVDLGIRARILQQGKDAFLEHVKQVEKGEQEYDISCLEDETGNPVMCRAGKSSFWVTWDWRLLACGMMNEPVEKLETGKFLDSWKAIVSKMDAIRLPVECAGCKYHDVCQTCAAMVYTETGGFKKAPKYRCNMTKMYLERCRLAVNRIQELPV